MNGTDQKTTDVVLPPTTITASAATSKMEALFGLISLRSLCLNRSLSDEGSVGHRRDEPLRGAATVSFSLQQQQRQQHQQQQLQLVHFLSWHSVVACGLRSLHSSFGRKILKSMTRYEGGSKLEPELRDRRYLNEK